MSDTSPAGYAYAVTPSDSADIAQCRALWVGGAGNLAIRSFDPNSQNSGSVTFVSVPAGTLLPVKTTRVFATGTTATNIVALA